MKIKSCTASFEQGGFDCKEAFNGITNDDGDGWAIAPGGHQGKIPAWAEFELDQKSEINSLTLMSDHHGSHRLIKFKITLFVDGEWIVPSVLSIKEVPDNKYYYNSDGTIGIVKPGYPILTLDFNLVSDVKSIRIDVFETDASNQNLVLREIIPKFVTKFSKFPCIPMYQCFMYLTMYMYCT